MVKWRFWIMTKTELIAEYKSVANCTTGVAADAVNVTLDVIKRALRRGEKVSIADFGIFKVVTQKARTCRNPQNGQTLNVPEKDVVRFKPTKILLDG
jgi:DNA-binding protein HU-beta